ncbi:MAG: GNAT family N-acetyltransferase [Acidimicrobiales bacterium]
MPAGIDGRLEHHLRSWLGAWPPRPGEILVSGTARREEPGWDGQPHPFTGVMRADGGAVLSVPRGAEPAVRALAGEGLDRLGEGLGGALGAAGGRLGRGCFRWSDAAAGLEDVGEWVQREDPRVPEWLRPFNGEVLVAWDDDGRYAAGVGRKQHDRWGHELAVATEERLQGGGLARRLVAQAARRVLADGAVPTYLHSHDNVASARVAEAAGFPDRGWQVLGLWGGGDAGRRDGHDERS